MQPFKYVRPADWNQAVQTVNSNEEARFLAGGTTLVDLMKLQVEKPAMLVDVNCLGWDNIAETNGVITIGASARNSDVSHHPIIRSRLPVLSEAMLSGASAQLRNMATVGGNIMQRTRCYYFRDSESPCNKREPGSGCPAIEGLNRIHAIFGTSSQCIATHASDMCVALSALDAVLHLVGPDGERLLLINEFYLLPEDHPEKETALRHGELIKAVEIPISALSEHSHYLKVRDRASYAFALVSAAVALQVERGTIRDARIALGGVAPKPWRCHDAEKSLRGKPANEASFRTAAELAVAGAQPQKYNRFKVELAKRTIVRALTEIGGA